MPAVEMAIGDPVADQFGYVEIQVLAADELYAGKLVAALDRQHPRDLFDVMQLLAGGGITPVLMDCFLVYLVSGNRPIAELLDPNPLPLQPVFYQQFKAMTLREVSVERLNQARTSMIQAIGQQLNDDQKAFLLSFKSGDPQWDLLEHAIASDQPAVQWKLRNIRKMNPARRAMALSGSKRCCIGNAARSSHCQAQRVVTWAPADREAERGAGHQGVGQLATVLRV